ncbi:MAG: hypothetical protein KJ995_06820 [Candidatus Omnitrophica bacterium]|nr:hypothetical protein [Candidatus Omnitrophota bacterium]MBU1852095.1 hypothetical protein [Candidatus Omnitrophota bacterium]
MRKLLVLATCLMFAGTGNIFAESKLQEKVELQRHTVELGTEISYIRYEEPGTMKETGAMYGAVASYAYHNRLMLKVDGKGSGGIVDYNGQLSNGTAYDISNITDYMFEIRSVAGVDFRILDATFLTPYIGLGYRHLHDDLACDPAGFGRESNYFYSPIGLEIVTKLANGWSIGGTAEYDLFWYGLQRTHLEDLSPELDTLNNNQHNGWGVRGSIKIRKKWDLLSIVIEPFVRYWNIGKSEDATITYGGTHIGTGYEPKNNSLEIGGKLAVIF